MAVDMTTGNPLRRILAFLIPTLLGNLLQQLYSMADSVIVSRFIGVQALAGVPATGSLTFLIMGFTWGLCAGCAIPMAQEFGAENYPRLRSCFANSFYLTLGTSAVIAAVTSILAPAILRLTDTPADIFNYSVTYIRIIFIGIPASVLYNLLSYAMRSVGDGKTPVLMLLVSSVLNIILDFVLVVPCHMGIAGAAVATVFSQLVSGILCIFVIKKKFDVLRIRREERALSLPVIAKLFRLGLPMGLQFSITAIGSIMMQSAVNSLGSTAVAAIGAGSKVQFIYATPADALSATMSTYCGQNIGARKIDRIKKGVRDITLLFAGYCAFAFVLQKLTGRFLVRLFIGDADPVLTEQTLLYLNTVLIFLFLLALIYIFRNSIQGLGFSQAAMFAGLMELLARGFAALVLVRRFGYNGAVYANPLAWIAADILLIPMFFAVIKKLEKQLNQEQLE